MRNTEHKPLTAPQPGLGYCAQDWLQPVASDKCKPCGANLEYDNDYAVLQSLLRPKVQVQYGSFTAEPEPPDWSDIERRARTLSQRTRDVTVLGALTRARTRRAGSAGLREGLAILHAQLHSWPEQVHPQTTVGTEHDPDGPLVRANALAALADQQGLLADIREVSISTSAAAPLTVKDVERALGPQTSAYHSAGPDAASVRAQLRQLQKKQDTHLLALQHSAQLAQQIEQWCQTQLQQDAPDLSALVRLLAYLQQYEQSTPKVQAEEVGHDEPGQPLQLAATDSPQLGTGHELGVVEGSTVAASVAQQRAHIRALLGQVIEWVEHHEPSSPVSIVLRQAQNLWGKRYAEIIAAVPPELLAQWDAQLAGQGDKK